MQYGTQNEDPYGNQAMLEYLKVQQANQDMQWEAEKSAYEKEKQALELQAGQLQLETLKAKLAEMTAPTSETVVASPSELDIANANYYNSLADFNSMRAQQIASEMDRLDRQAAVSGGSPAVMYTKAMADYDFKLFGRPTAPDADTMIFKPITTLKQLAKWS